MNQTNKNYYQLYVEEVKENRHERLFKEVIKCLLDKKKFVLFVCFKITNLFPLDVGCSKTTLEAQKVR